MTSMHKERIFDLDRAKGLGIFLVVLGHIVARDNPLGVEWYPILKERIYLFHMPFFMFVSGAIAGYAWKPVNSISEYGTFVKKRAERLLPAYLLFAFIVFAGKLAAQSLTPHVDNPVKNLWSFFDVILTPYQSFSGFLWFVFVLFLLYAMLPALLYASKNKAIILLPAAALLQFIPATPYFGIYSFREYLFVFLLGFFVMRSDDAGNKYYDTLTKHLDRWWLLWAGALVGGLIATHESLWGDFLHLGNHDDFKPYKILFGMLSIPALLGLVRSPAFTRSELLLTFGKYTFAIYLMNTMAIGAVKAVLFKVAPWDGLNFFWYAPLLLVSGIVLPILAKKYAINRLPYLEKITN
jgi:fucose 4-O-acetylase-like acetyltransferase